VIITYDITKQDSFEEVKSYWMKEIENYANWIEDILVLGNKSDCSDQRQVFTETGLVRDC